jgi:hypothetical protein
MNQSIEDASEFEAWFEQWRVSTWRPLPSDERQECPKHWAINAKHHMSIAWQAARQSSQSEPIAYRWGNENAWLLTDEKPVSNDPSIFVQPLFLAAPQQAIPSDGQVYLSQNQADYLKVKLASTIKSWTHELVSKDKFIELQNDYIQSFVLSASPTAPIDNGREVSMDVSTGDDDIGNRIFGNVIGIQDGIILVEETARNFAAPIDNVAVKKVLDLCQPLETVEYWAKEHAREPYKTGGGKTVQLLLEYMELRRALIPTQANRTEG